jgi:hypothetical protein
MADKNNIVKMTTIEARTNSFCVGHETLFNSASTEIKKSANFGQFKQGRAGIEPATAGFGNQCSAN